MGVVVTGDEYLQIKSHDFHATSHDLRVLVMRMVRGRHVRSIGHVLVLKILPPLLDRNGRRLLVGISI